MNSTTSLMLRIGALILGAAIVIAAYNHKASHITDPVAITPEKVPAQGFELGSARILVDGNFEFISKSGVRIRGRLRGGITPEAKSEIIRLLNSAEKGRIMVVECGVDICTVDVLLTIKQSENGVPCLKEVNLADWLQQNKLLYQMPQPPQKKK